MTGREKKLIASLLVVAPFVLFVPWKSQIVPAWKLRVVDESGTPISHLAVSQNWIDPDFEDLWLEQDYKTDENGFVTFPERGARRNLLLALNSSLWNRILYGKKRYDAMAFGWGDFARGEVYYRSGQAIPAELVMYR